jgi:hypothetical protein
MTTASRRIETMTDRADERRQVAARMSRQFTMAEFKRLYRQMFPDRPVNSIMPYEYAPRPIPTERPGPKFLKYLGRGRYERLE